MKGKRLTRRHWMLQSTALAAGGCHLAGGETVRRLLAHAPGPADNPMKGFLPFAGDRREIFPHSLEWALFPLSAIMTGPGRFDFGREFDPTIEAIAGRGHQAALRFYLDYPGRPSGVPRFLVDHGVRLIPYTEHGGGLSPDYRNDELTQALLDFIAALGERYDGDPRLGYLTLGLLGFWGEWHTWPREDLMAVETVQRRIMKAFADAFARTPLLMRYPVADAMTWPIGLHDDSFAHSTIGDQPWELVPRIRAAGAGELWRTRPIGGEIRPEVQPHLWKDPGEAFPPGLQYQDYAECVRRTRATWMINEHVFRRPLPAPEYERALEGARGLGYELHLPAVEVPAALARGAPAGVAVELENRGVAPLYAAWKMDLVAVGAAGEELGAAPFEGTLDTVQPGDAPVRRLGRVTLPASLPEGGCSLRLRPPRAFAGARPLRFANAGSDPDDGVIVLARYDGSGRLLPAAEA